MKKVQRKTDCWIWPYSINRDGYGNLGRNGKVVNAYKYIYEMLIRKVPANCELDHICKNRLCVNPTHLEPVSHAENCRRGNQTKLTKENVKEIRRLSAKMTHQDIAKKFNVSRQSIGLILSGKRWV